MGKAVAVTSNVEMRKKDNLNIALDDGRQFSFSDQTPGDLRDPATGRTVTGVSWTMYDPNGNKTAEAHNGTISYAPGFQYASLTIEVPGVINFTQDGEAIPDPPPSQFSTLRFNYVEIV